MSARNNEIVLNTFDENGDNIASHTDSATIPTSEWLRTEIDFGSESSNTIAFKLFDASGSEIASTSMADDLWDDGGVGFGGWADSDEVAWVDGVRVI